MAVELGALTSPPHFDVCGPLPGPGVTVLEASAGTGKTFTIAALVARMVAEGVAPLSEILVVTFTRMATGELRDRVRARLVSAESALGGMLDAGDEIPADDAVLQLLAAGGPPLVEQRRKRLADALASFDNATITTTHGFCHMVLAALGVWGGFDAAPTLVEDPTDLVEEAVDDLLTRHILLRSAAVPFRRRAALDAGLIAVKNPKTPLDPAANPDDPTAMGLRRRLAAAVRDEVRRRLLDYNLLTYDDLLVRLANALADEWRGPHARLRLRERYSVVLVDEFQDTDTVQWEVVHQAFGDGATRLVLVGDPKQAVYSFRGADVYAYLDAARTAGPGHRFTLGQNWRSDASLLSAYDALFDPLHLGHPEIVYRRATATTAHQRPGLEGAPKPEPLRARMVYRDGSVTRTTTGLLQKDAAVRFVADDLAADVAGLLRSGATLVHRGGDNEADPRPRPVGAGDIAVLVRINRQATVVQSALQAAGVPVVVAGAQSVLSTAAARQWLRLLEALEHPAGRSQAAGAALTPFLGLTASELAEADEKTWGELHARLHDWSGLIRRGGVAMLFWHILATEKLPARLVRVVNGERHLTDLGHIAELLHAEATSAQLGLAALRTWLARRIDEVATDGAEAELRSRRLDSDAAAVQVLTVHRAKGLEFPIVYCPYLWDAGWRDQVGEPVVFHDHSERRLDVGGEAGDPVYKEHYQKSKDERRGEDLRHLYVALTRAKHQAVVWWAGVQDCQHSALGRLLLARGPEGDVAASGRPREPKDEVVEAELRRLAARAPGLISVERCPLPPEPEGGPAPPPAAIPLSAASFSRHLDLAWRRSSYTSITAASHTVAPEPDDSPLVGSEPEDPGTTDEPALAAAVGSPTGAVSLPSLLAAVAAGADVGTLVHKVLERVDFAAGDLRSALLDAARAQQGDGAAVVVDADVLAGGLEAAILTPLGDLVPGASLRDFGPGQRLDELGFELPLAGGDDRAGQVLLTDVANLMAEHIGPGHPLYGYADRLDDPLLVTDLRGYLTGSLDAVLRWSVNGVPRYFVADYKTNWLGGAGEDLTTWHYRPEAMVAAMRRAHYPLQAIFYLVALHRYLRWRQPGYHPEVHLGGALYLFVRGMVGPATPRVGSGPCGVFSWRPPVAMVTALSDLLDGAPVQEGAIER
jgi:exodeoxyribonuclease V beta subunit